MKKEFDNILIASVGTVLTESTTLARCYPLIPLRDQLVASLSTRGIKDKYDFIAADKAWLAASTSIGIEQLHLFEYFLHLYDFIERKLKEIRSVDEHLLEALANANIKHSSEYLKLCLSQSAETISQKFGIDKAQVTKLFCLCDLMRLPGVKEVRATLYFDCGYTSLQSFAEQNPQAMRNDLAEKIQTLHIEKSLPLLKELSTQIALAKCLPHLGLT